MNDTAKEFRAALQHVMDVFDAHQIEDMDSLNCDGTDDVYCDCLENAMKNLLKVYQGE